MIAFFAVLSQVKTDGLNFLADAEADQSFRDRQADASGDSAPEDGYYYTLELRDYLSGNGYTFGQADSPKGAAGAHACEECAHYATDAMHSKYVETVIVAQSPFEARRRKIAKAAGGSADQQSAQRTSGA